MSDLTWLIIPCKDYGFQLVFSCKRYDGTAFNLTGYTVAFNVWTATRPLTKLVSGACSLTATPEDGIATYVVALNDFAVVGNFKGEIEATKMGVRETFNPFDIKVIESA